VHGVGAGTFGSADPGDVALAPRFSSGASPVIYGLYLSGSHGSSSPPINWRWVEDEAESACS
jgi:hypothetical protein